MTTEIPVRADRSLKQAGAAANVRDEEEGAESSPPVEPAQDWWSPSSPLPPGLLGLLLAVLRVFTEFSLITTMTTFVMGHFCSGPGTLRTSGFTTRKTEA